jgi:hypothetical protein
MTIILQVLNYAVLRSRERERSAVTDSDEEVMEERKEEGNREKKLVTCR